MHTYFIVIMSIIVYNCDKSDKIYESMECNMEMIGLKLILDVNIVILNLENHYWKW